MRVTCFFWAALLTFAALPCPAAWKAGVARVNITPAESIWMAGYASRDHPSEGVYAPLYVKALALEDETGKSYVLVSSDLLGFTRSMSDAVFERVAGPHSLTRDRLVLNASHTHSGPVTGQLLRPAYILEPEDEVVVKRYTAKLVEQTAELIGRALAKLEPVELSFEQGFAGFAVNRRRVGHREYPGPVDHDVPVLAIRKLGGDLSAVLFGYSCHATVTSDYEIHGDWPGFAQSEIERIYPETVALFINGCGADQNPLPRRRIELARKYGETLAVAVQLVLEAKMKPVAGPLRTVHDTVRLPLQVAPTRAELERRRREGSRAERQSAAFLLAKLDRGESLPDGYDYPIQVWRFGGDLTFISLAGEVVADYSLILKKKFGWDNTWVSGYNNDVFAYIPTRRIVREGGYEGATSMLGYGLPAPFEESVEDLIIDKVEELRRRLGP